MHQKVVSDEISLRSGQPIRLHDALGTCVHCADGIVWITMVGETADIFLEAGESCTIKHQGLSLVESIGNAVICLEKFECSHRLKKQQVNLPSLWNTALDKFRESSRTAPAA